MNTANDPFGVVRKLRLSDGEVCYYSLEALESMGMDGVSRLPKTIRILLESVLRNVDEFSVRKEDVRAVAEWNPGQPSLAEIPFKPARVVLQDFTGVPSVVDLAALREACQRLGKDPAKINPLVPCDLVIDHSVQVDHYGSTDALEKISTGSSSVTWSGTSF